MVLYFRAKDPAEEHAIINRFLCPDCRIGISWDRHVTVTPPGKPIRADLLECSCKECREKYLFLFYLPKGYDPLKVAGITAESTPEQASDDA